MVRKSPNSGSRSTTSPSVKTNCVLCSFLAASTMAICCAATDNTGRSIRLNSSKQPHDPDCARPAHQCSDRPTDRPTQRCVYLFTTHCHSVTAKTLYLNVTRSSAVADGPRDASCQLKSCQLPRNSAETTCTTSPEQTEVMKLEGYRGPMCNKHVHSTMT